MGKKAIEWARKHCGMYSTMGATITVDAIELERLIEKSNELFELERWATESLAKFGTKEQLDWTESGVVLNALQMLPGLISKFNEDREQKSWHRKDRCHFCLGWIVQGKVHHCNPR